MGSTILVVEDDQAVLQMLNSLFSLEGFEVTEARDGREALRLIGESSPPHAIVLDIMLPYLMGFQLITEIRRKPEWKEVPIIMLTARTHETDVIRAISSGANAYIMKPFQPDELLSRVKELITERGEST